MANRQDHIIVFILSTLIFLTGIFAGLTLSRGKISDIENQIQNFEDNINSMELSVLLSDALKNDDISCKFLHGKLNETRELLTELGATAVEYEEESRIKEEAYKNVKKQYNFARAEYWLMLEKLKKQCNNNYTTILFFYGTEQPCPDCRDQGVILTHLSSLNPNYYVIPVDFDEELLIIDMIKEAYQLNQTPTLVIDASIVKTGIISREEIINITQQAQASQPTP